MDVSLGLSAIFSELLFPDLFLPTLETSCVSSSHGKFFGIIGIAACEATASCPTGVLLAVALALVDELAFEFEFDAVLGLALGFAAV
jgi:hypothetical protein